VQYAGIREEHKAVRNQVGIFDVSHMGEIETEGPDAEAFLQHILSNDVTKIAQDGAQYSVLCNEAGGVLDDLFTYRLGHDRFLTVTNAANHEKDLAWFQRHAADFDVRIHDRISDYAMLAIQGPEARALVQRLSDGELPKRFRTATLQVAGVDALVAGTGYTGEDGVEILTAPGNAPTIWDAATQEGAQPAGLGARDTLRLEVCFHLYGNDLSEDRGPIEAGLGWCCKEDTNFVGSDIVRAARENGTPEKLVPFALTGPGIARQGNAINGGGVVTSGTLSPCLDIGIGMAYLPAEKAVPGTPFEIDVRGKTRPAEVRTKPLYSKES
jgi:aminomethyltransferase